MTYLARMPVSTDAIAMAARDRGWAGGRAIVFDEGKALHHLLTERLGRKEFQPFRLKVAPGGRRGWLHGYTSSSADELREMARGIAVSKEHEDAVPLDLLETKEMPRFSAGKRIGFDLRARPVVRLDTAIPACEDRDPRRRHGFKKGAEIDAFLAATIRNPDRGASLEAGISRESVYADWLKKRFRDVADVEAVRLSRFQRTRAARGGAVSEGPDAVFHGTLNILDADAFADRLRRGIGRHRSYGFGMLLVGPPGEAAMAA